MSDLRKRMSERRAKLEADVYETLQVILFLACVFAIVVIIFLAATYGK